MTMNAQPQNDDCEETLKNLLSVPTDLILSYTQQNPTKRRSSKRDNVEVPNSKISRKRKLLHGEASCFVKVRILATEVDILLNIVSEVLGRRMLCREYSENIACIVSSNSIRLYDHHFCHNLLPYKMRMQLRSILPILHVHGEHMFLSQLSYVESEISRCLVDLYNCGEVLHQFSEQNLSIAEQLSDMFAFEDEDKNDKGTESDGSTTEIVDERNRRKNSFLKGHELVKEKMTIGEIEEAMSSRINALIKMTMVNSGTDNPSEKDNSSDNGNCSDSDSSIKSSPSPTLNLDVFDSERDPETGKFITMKALCSRLVNRSFDTHDARNSIENSIDPSRRNPDNVVEKSIEKQADRCQAVDGKRSYNDTSKDATDEVTLQSITHEINAEANEEENNGKSWEDGDGSENGNDSETQRNGTESTGNLSPQKTVDNVQHPTESIDDAATTLTALRSNL